MLRNIMYQKGLKNNSKGPTAEVFAAMNTIITNQRKTFLSIKTKFQEAECLDGNPRDKWVQVWKKKITEERDSRGNFHCCQKRFVSASAAHLLDREKKILYKISCESRPIDSLPLLLTTYIWLYGICVGKETMFLGWDYNYSSLRRYRTPSFHPELLVRYSVGVTLV